MIIDLKLQSTEILPINMYFLRDSGGLVNPTTHGARYNGSRSVPPLSSRRRDIEFVLIAAPVSRRVLALDAALTRGVRPLSAATDDLDAAAVIARDSFEIKAIVPGFCERANKKPSAFFLTSYPKAVSS